MKLDTTIAFVDADDYYIGFKYSCYDRVRAHLQPRYLILLLIDAHTLERSIVATIIRERLIVKVHDVGDHIVDKVAVVRDDQQRLGVGLQVIFEPQHGREIEVVLRTRGPTVGIEQV